MKHISFCSEDRNALLGMPPICFRIKIYFLDDRYLGVSTLKLSLSHDCDCILE